MIVLSIPMAVGATLLADRIVAFMSGDKYSTFTGSVMVLQILIWAAVFIFLSSAYGAVATSSNKQSMAMRIAGICMALNFVLNLALIPFYSYDGAAIATLLTELTSLLLYVLVLDKSGFKLSRGIFIGTVKVVLASLLMAAYILLLRDLNLFLLVATAAVIYLVTIYLFRGLDKDDMKILLSFLAKQSNK